MSYNHLTPEITLVTSINNHALKTKLNLTKNRLKGVYDPNNDNIYIYLQNLDKRRIIKEITNTITHELLHYYVEHSKIKDKYLDIGEEWAIKLASLTYLDYKLEKKVFELRTKLATMETEKLLNPKRLPKECETNETQT